MIFLLHAIPGLAERLRRRRGHERLQDLPDYLLDDIGLRRDHPVRPRATRPF